ARTRRSPAADRNAEGPPARRARLGGGARMTWDRTALVVLAIDFLAIGALPRVFFRPGRLNPSWWLTAVPFFVCPAFVLVSALGWAPVSPRWAGWLGPWPPAASAVLAVASLVLIAFTLGTHRVPIALWHQEGDSPRHIVTWGAYARIRHPFYASFLLA